MTDEERTNENQAVIDLMERLHGVEVTTISAPDDDPGSREAVAVLLPSSEGMKLVSLKTLLDEWRTAPERATGTASFTDLDSFCEHVSRFKDPGTTIFADDGRPEPSLVAVLDYNRPDQARFGQHRARYTFPVADAWSRWTTMNEHTFNQAALAAFIEDNILDIADPADAGETAKAMAKTLGCELAMPMALLALSRGLSIHVEQKISQHQRLATGEARISFEETHTDTAGGQLRIPGAFLLALPVFRGGTVYQVPARLRYRVAGATATWSYALFRCEDVFDHAIKGACDIAREKTGCPVLLGTPER